MREDILAFEVKNMHDLLFRIICTVHGLIYSVDYKERSKNRPEDFTRMRKMSFVQTLLFILGKTKTSLQAGLNAFFESINDGEETYSKQAFSKGRLRIKPEAIKELFEVSVREFYAGAQAEFYRGFRVSAIDGSRYNLPTSEELRKTYGEQTTSGASQIQALGSCLYDVMNSVLIDVSLNRCDANERVLAEKHLDNLKKYASESLKELILFDRGYPSAKLIQYVQNSGYFYLMRCSNEFVRGMKLSGNNCVITHKFQALPKEPIQMRFVRFALPCGETEILVTNIFDPDFTVEDFKMLYWMRWNIETRYNDIKNKLELENFSGKSETVILQDFYATMFLTNLAAALAYDNREQIEALHNSEENKLVYKLNIAMTISELKRYVVKLVMTDNKLISWALLVKISKHLRRCVVPVRPGRKFSRNKMHKKSSYPSNMRKG